MIAENSADVLVALKATDIATNGIVYTISALMGAGLALSTLGMAASIIQTKGKVDYAKRIFNRDMVILAVLVLMIVGIGIYGQITWYLSLMFLSTYIVLAVLVLVLDYRRLSKIRLLKE